MEKKSPEAVRALRQKKLERVFLYEEYEEMTLLHHELSWEQFLHVRELRREKESDSEYKKQKLVNDKYWEKQKEIKEKKLKEPRIRFK